MRVHVLLGYAAVAACVVCLGLAFAARALGNERPVRLFTRGRSTAASDEVLALARLARKVGAVAVLLMLASKCAGSY